jgi:uncharacterized membrane protein
LAEENIKEKATEKKSTDTISDSKLMALLSYFWILSIVMYVIKKDDEFVRFHARQGMVIFGFSLLGIIPVLGWIIDLIMLAAAIIGAIKAYQGEKYKLPVIGDIAEKINF